VGRRNRGAALSTQNPSTQNSSTQNPSTRIAMWSGPRNISTAMMRSFSSRADTIVVDEPLYAHYLATTGTQHPDRDAVIASQPVSWRLVAESLTGPLPPGTAVLYQKHMTHHMLPDIDQAWLTGFTHAYLIRDPAHVVASYAQVRAEPTLDDLGYPQQVSLFRQFPGPVIDAKDVLLDPRGTLIRLCAALGIRWDAAMLHWPKGPRDTDGVWAPHWYASVESSTCFAPYDARPPQVPAHLKSLVDAAMPFYQELANGNSVR
jgi:hypothetical protein